MNQHRRPLSFFLLLWLALALLPALCAIFAPAWREESLAGLSAAVSGLAEALFHF